MKLKYVLLFVTLILLIGLATASATQSDDNTTTTKTITQPDTAKYESTDYAKTDTTKQINTDERQNTDTKRTTKQIRKNTQPTTTKQETQPVTVRNYEELSNALTSGDYKDLTVDLKGESDTYTSSGTITVRSTIENLTINGNGRTITGNNNVFLILNNINVTLKNITVTGCKGQEGGVIKATNTNLTISDSAFTSNHATKYGGVLYQSGGKTTITNTTFTGNSIIDREILYPDGAVIKVVNNGILTLDNNTFDSNSIGATTGFLISTTQTSKIVNNLFINNDVKEDQEAEDPKNAAGLIYPLVNEIYDNDYVGNKLSAIIVEFADNDYGQKEFYTDSIFDVTIKLGHDAYNDTVRNGTLEVSINDNPYATFDVINSTATVRINYADYNDYDAIRFKYIPLDYSYSTQDYSIRALKGELDQDDIILTATSNKTVSVGQNITIRGKVEIYDSVESYPDTQVPLGGVKVRLLQGTSGSTSLGETFTDSQGNYVFNYLATSTGTIKFRVRVVKENGIGKAKTSSALTTTVTGIPTNITLSATNIKFKENTTISGKVYNFNSLEKVSGGSVNITVSYNNRNVFTRNNVALNDLGEFSITYNATNGGIHNVTVKYNPSGDYQTSTNYTTFTVLPIITNMTIKNNESILVGQEVTVEGVLYDEWGFVVPETKVNITVGLNDPIEINVNSTGGYHALIPINEVGVFDIVVEYFNHTQSYINSTNTSSVIVNARNTNMTINNNKTILVGQEVTINGTLYDQLNEPVKNTKINITVDGTLIKNVAVNNQGFYSTKCKINNTGTIPITITYNNHTTNYTKSTNTSSVKVNPRNTNMTINNNASVQVGQEVNITGILHDNLNEKIPKTVLTIRIGKNYINEEVQVDENGEFELQYTTTDIGSYNITIYYDSNNANYTSSINMSSFIVKPRNTNMTILNNGPIKVGQNVTIKGTLTDTIGEKVPDTFVNIKVGSETINNVRVNGNGEYTASIKLDEVKSYDIIVEYKNHTTKYTSSTNTSSVKVTAPNTNMTITATNVIIGQNTTISGTLHDEYDKPIGNTKLSISVDGKVINNSVTVDSSGKYHITYNASSVGKHHILVTFTGNANYIGSTNTTTFTVTPRNSHIIINTVKSVKVGQKATITGTLMDSLGETIKNTYVNITVNSIPIFNVPVDSKGNYKTTYTTTIVGQNNVTVTYNNNTTNYTGSTNKTTFIVNPLGTNSSISVSNVLVDQYTTISGTLHDEYGNPIPNTKLSLRVDNNYINDNIKVDSNGKYKVSYNATSVGQHTIKIIYTTTSANYTSSINTTTFKATSRDTILTINNDRTVKVGQSTTLSGSLSDELAEPVAYAKVTITIGDQTINAVTDENGKFTATTAINSTGLQTITVTYNNLTSKYTGSKKTSSITVNPRNTIVTIDTVGTVPANSYVTISGALTDEFGEKVVSTKVTVNVNKNVYNNVTVDKNGKYSLVYRADTVGTNNVTVTYKNTTTYYTGSSNTTTFKVNKLSSSLKLDSLKPVEANDTSVVSGTLKDSNGNPIAKATVKVVLNNKKIVYATTDSNGRFTAKFTSMASGLNNFSVVYAGNNTYKSSSAKISQNVTKKVALLTVDNIVGTLGEKIKLTAHLTDTNGKKITSGNIVFKLNGKTLRVDGSFNSSKSPLKISVVNGLATTNILGNLNIRDAENLTATYSGTSIYDKANSKTATVNIRKRDAKITVTTNIPMVKQNRDIVFKTSVTDITKNHKNKTSINQDGYVFFKVNGKTLKDRYNKTIQVAVKNGKANYTYHVPTGTGGIDNNKNIRNYTVTAGYSNEYFYPDAKANTTYNVERSPITIKITSVKVSKGIVSIKGTIKDYEGKYVVGNNKVCVKINGATYQEGGKYKYFTVANGKIDLTGIKANTESKIKSISIVTGERQAYLGGRATTTNIKS